MRNFLEEFQFHKSWDSFEVDFTMCHEINEQSQVATLDHFFWNHDLEGKVSDAGVIHSPDNFSDHCPINCIINDDIPDSIQTIQNCALPKPKWKKATIVEKEVLDVQLQMINIPESVLNCTDVHCKDDTHRSDSDVFMTSVLESVDAIAINVYHYPTLVKKWSNPRKSFLVGPNLSNLSVTKLSFGHKFGSRRRDP